jgi:hypothetical protein
LFTFRGTPPSASRFRELEFPPDIELENGYGSPDFDALYLVQLANENPSATEALAVRPLRAYPNPSSGALQVELPTSMTLMLRNAQGQAVWERYLPKGTRRVNFGSLPTGPYWLSGYADGRLYHSRLIIR